MSTLKTNAIQTIAGKPILNSTGSILKVASNSLTTPVTTTSTSLVNTGLITQMTPTNTNSNFFVMLNHGRWGTAGANAGIVMNMYVSVNGGAYAAAFSGNRNETLHYNSGATNQGEWSYSSLYIPGTSVSSIAFQPYFREAVNAGTASFNITDTNGYGEVFLTIFEISA
jgi:hypothetical protein